jgi:hypothetical protein
MRGSPLDAPNRPPPSPSVGARKASTMGGTRGSISPGGGTRGSISPGGEGGRPRSTSLGGSGAAISNMHQHHYHYHLYQTTITEATADSADKHDDEQDERDQAEMQELAEMFPEGIPGATRHACAQRTATDGLHMQYHGVHS